MEDKVQHQVDAILGTKTDSGHREVPVYEHEDGSVRTFNVGDDIGEYIKSTGDTQEDSGEMTYTCQPYEELADALKGTRWKSVGGELVLEEDFRFHRDHGFPQTGHWEVCRPAQLWLRADDDDDNRCKAEAFGASQFRLNTSAADSGFNYLPAKS